MNLQSGHTSSTRCLRCAECCRWPGHVLLTAEDVARLASHLGMTEATLVNRYAVLARNRAQLSLAEEPDGACVFLEGRACRVYPARPQQCREFPEKWGVTGGCAARVAVEPG